MKKFALAALALSVPSFASAADLVVDYAAIGTGIQGQLGTAIPAALIVLGVIMGVTVGIKLFKRFAK